MKSCVIGLNQGRAWPSGPPWKSTMTGHGFDAHDAGRRTSIGMEVPSRAGYDSRVAATKRLVSISGALGSTHCVSLRPCQSHT